MKSQELSEDTPLLSVMNKEEIHLQINDTKFQLPYNPPVVSEDQPWYDLAKKHEIPHEHASLLNLAIGNLKQNPENIEAAINSTYTMV